jgi:hypothetical protein
MELEAMTCTDQPESSDAASDGNPTRRDFLGRVSSLTVAGTAASAGVPADAAETDPNLLPTIRLGTRRVTRLILGGNPVYGHSHFNQLYSQQLRDYHTRERVVELLKACAAAGINTWQNSYTERTVQDVLRCREEGIPFNWLLLGKGNWVERPEYIEEAAAFKPLGIAPHGSSSERLHRAGRLRVLRDMLKRIRQTGVLVGLSAHNPQIIELAEEQHWDVDYYMCCMYYINRPREEFEKLLGEAPLGEIYLPSDRQKMLRVIRAASKPCLAYKVLAAGRANLSSTGVRQAFQETLAAIKPTDGMIVGMFQQLGDQVGVNARVVRELCAG